jgi:predicted GIY-YIG superfamily endonuclease
VYVLSSDSDPSRPYVGIASNVDERLDWHNAGPCGYTEIIVRGRSRSQLSSQTNKKQSALSNT